jgi:hypothetical protein
LFENPKAQIARPVALERTLTNLGQLTPNEAISFERDDHLVDRGWADLKVALHIGLGGRPSEDVRVGADESQVLALLFGEALSTEAASGA